MSFGNVLGQQTDLSQYVTESEVDSKISTATSGMATQSWVNQQIQANAGGWTQICQWTSVGEKSYVFTNVPCAFKLTVFSTGNRFNSGTLNLLFNHMYSTVCCDIYNNGSSTSNKGFSIIIPVIYIGGYFGINESVLLYTSNHEISTGASPIAIFANITLNRNNAIELSTNNSISNFTATLYAMF